MGSDTRQKILEEGVRLIRREGYNSTGLTEILSAAEVPRGSFYHYFRNKEDFGIEVIDYLQKRIGDTFCNYLTGEENSSVPPLTRLKRFFAEFRETIASSAQKSGCGFGNISQELAASHNGFREKLQEVYSYLTAIISLSLDEAIEAGDLPSTVDARELAQFIFNSWEGALIFVKVLDDDSPLRLFEKFIFNSVLPSQDEKKIDCIGSAQSL